MAIPLFIFQEDSTGIEKNQGKFVVPGEKFFRLRIVFYLIYLLQLVAPPEKNSHS
jgi:hypothetical protein